MGGTPLRGSLTWTLAWRLLRGRRSRLLAGTARAALAATGIGVTAMVIAMALMTGYQEDLQRKLSSGNAAVLAIPLGMRQDAEVPEPLEELATLPTVRRVSPVVLGQGVLSSASKSQGTEVTLRGVEPGSGPFTASEEQLEEDAEGVPGVVLGAELARSLEVEEGEVLRLVAVGFADGRPRFHYRSLRFAGTFSSGLAEFDSAWLLVHRRQAANLFGSAGGSTMYEIEPVDLRRASEVADQVEALLGTGYLVTNWLDLNRELFAALRLQKLFLFLVLGLIVFVSTFNVASTLMVTVRERMREVGVLGALGLAPRRLWRVFLLYGGLLGLMGVAGGVLLGCLAAWIIDAFDLIRFDAEVAAIYFIDSVRFRIEPLDVLAIVAFALAVNLLACAVPAWRASKVDPATALSYE